jgi:peroxiredoxin
MVIHMRGTAQTTDDGAYGHLTVGTVVPRVALPATTGQKLDIVAPSAYTVIFLYPMTGIPGEALPEGWLELQGAFGCSAQSCAYRDLLAGFAGVGATVHGVSTQAPSEQKEFSQREQINFPLLSDSEHLLVAALDLPLFEVEGHPARIKRATLIVDRNRVLRTVMYPIPDPPANARLALHAVQQLAGEQPR